MSLREKLTALKENFESGGPPMNASPDIIATMHRATEEIRTSGILERILNVGSQAPDFSLQNTAGNTVYSRELLSGGPLVISFYRGMW